MKNETDPSGCTACKLSSFCNQRDEAEQCVPEAVANRALLIAFVIPLALLLIVLVVGLVAHCSELLMALLMLGALVLYYIGLRIFQNKLIKL